MATAESALDFVPKKRGAILTYIRRNPTITIGGALLLIMAALAVFAPFLGTTDPQAISPRTRLRPSALLWWSITPFGWEVNLPYGLDWTRPFWFGSDSLGRDLYSRVIYGARVSMIIGFSVAICATLVGLTIGLVSGYIRWLDAIVMRVMDGMMSIPPILLAVALMALTRASMENVILAITVAEVPRVSRLVRGVVLGLREQPFVEAAIANGTRLPAILLRHILPNTVAPLMVQATYICASAMITEAILSFIGAGTPPTIPSWGNVIAESRALFQVRPEGIFFPAIFLSITVLAVNLLGDGLRDALDPRLARKL
jgi:peptide/nickel transport system permease protein